MCGLWTSYYHCNVGQGSPAIAWGIEVSRPPPQWEREEKKEWKKEISVTIAVLSSDRERNNKSSFALDRKGVSRLILYIASSVLHELWSEWTGRFSGQVHPEMTALAFSLSVIVALWRLLTVLWETSQVPAVIVQPEGRGNRLREGYATSHGLA